MTFKEAREQNAQNGPFLNVDHFAESCTYRPQAGPEQTVTASVRYVHEADLAAPAGELEREEIWVKVLKDETHARGGIAHPEIGDVLLRATDLPNEPWTFQGRIDRETPHSWYLLFARNRPRRFGPR